MLIASVLRDSFAAAIFRLCSTFTGSIQKRLTGENELFGLAFVDRSPVELRPIEQ